MVPARLARTIGFVPAPDVSAIRAALATVNDPEIRKPITDLGMVESEAAESDG
jgi:ATP-binding protein involved in chromosome partitioning